MDRGPAQPIAFSKIPGPALAHETLALDGLARHFCGPASHFCEPARRFDGPGYGPCIVPYQKVKAYVLMYFFFALVL